MNLASFAELAVRLVNSAAGCAAADPLRSREAFRALIADRPALHGPVRQHDLDRLKLLRDELAAIFASCSAQAEDEAVAAVNTLLMIHPALPVLIRHDDEAWHLHLSSTGSAADRYAAAAVFGLTTLIARYGVDRLGRCPVTSCDRVFADASNDRSRGYCAEHRAQEFVTSIHPKARQRRHDQADARTSSVPSAVG